MQPANAVDPRRKPRPNRGSLATRAYLMVRDRILKGQIPLGAALSRRKLAAELDIGLVPVTESAPAPGD